ncbi:hypothetical protein ALV80_09055 [Lactobacillus helveticus]|uniref:Uncharacterized protein n=1 Tax=Lactobacillus helveticus TaxID=1587 RepID=A0AAC8W9L3_LACHE|nr:hypothetical protein ALV80_09055 [Lactobacillus helveticus]
MSSFFNAIKNLLTAYHIDKSSTGKIIEPFFITGDYVLLFYAIKKLLTAYHIDKSSTGKIIEPY